jgi:hypothetical protein
MTVGEGFGTTLSLSHMKAGLILNPQKVLLNGK